MESALHQLEGVCYYVLKEGNLLVLGPGTLHIVLSPVNSAVVGWNCYKSEWVKDLYRLMSWDKKLSCQSQKTFDEKLSLAWATYQRLFGGSG